MVLTVWVCVGVQEAPSLMRLAMEAKKFATATNQARPPPPAASEPPPPPPPPEPSSGGFPDVPDLDAEDLDLDNLDFDEEELIS